MYVWQLALSVLFGVLVGMNGRNEEVFGFGCCLFHHLTCFDCNIILLSQWLSSCPTGVECHSVRADRVPRRCSVVL